MPPRARSRLTACLSHVFWLEGFVCANVFLAARPDVMPRKGVPAHSQILANYLRGADIGSTDVVIWCDLLPNRRGSLNLPP